MDRKTFDSLSIEEQVNCINESLKKGISLGAFGKSIGIAKSTVGTRLKTAGYIRNSDTGCYVLEGLEAVNEEKNNDEKEVKQNIEISTIPQIEELIKRIEKIEQELESFKTESKMNQKSFKNEYKFKPQKFETDVKQITARLNQEVFKKLERMYDEYNMISKQVILNSLLNEVLDKYLK